MSSRALRDHVITGSQEQFDKAISDLAARLGEITKWINSNVVRTERRETMINFSVTIREYLLIALAGGTGHVSVLALATRSIYEIHLKIRVIIRSEEELNRWLSEAATDKIQTLEGILSLNTTTKMEKERSILLSEIDRIQKLISKYGLPEVKTPVSAAAMAADLGISGEHKSLFKLFSKLVHPSSYLINNYNDAASQEMRAILQIHLQLYAWDSLSRISKLFLVPEQLTIPQGAIH